MKEPDNPKNKRSIKNLQEKPLEGRVVRAFDQDPRHLGKPAIPPDCGEKTATIRIQAH